MKKITGILLAAGQSSRFGSNKLLHRLSSGMEVGLQSAHNLGRVIENLVVVVSGEDKEFYRLLDQDGFNVARCNNTCRDLSDSLKTGITTTMDADAWVIALADMPFIHSEVYEGVVRKLEEGQSLVRPRFQGRAGHPAGISKLHRNKLLEITGDKGARTIFESNPDKTTFIETACKGAILDIDRPEDIYAAV